MEQLEITANLIGLSEKKRRNGNDSKISISFKCRGSGYSD